LKQGKEHNVDELKGTTLKIYRRMLKEGRPMRISDLHRDLQASSPSLIQYHLKKLLNLGLVSEKQEGYVVEKVVIESVFRIRRTLVPFQLAYVIFFSLTLVAMLAIGWPLSLTSFNVIAVAANASALATSVYEMSRTLRTLA
jgi:predicted DNA-binding transcriptional regulator